MARSLGALQSALALGLGILGGSALAAAPAPVPVPETAQALPTQGLLAFHIEAGALAPAITLFAQQAGIFISSAAQLAQGMQTSGVQGHYTVNEGLQRLLMGTPLEAVALDSESYALRPVAETAMNARDFFARNTLPEVSVKASRIEDGDAFAPASNANQALLEASIHAGILGARPALSTPFSTSAYAGQWLHNQQAQSVGDVLKYDPTVRNFFPEDSLGEYFYIRGLYTQSQEFAWNGLYGLAPHYRSASEMLERVELLRGPSALLYGMSQGGGTGGVVNLVPKRARQTPLTRVTVSAQTARTLGLHLDLSRRFGQEQALGVRLNLLRASGKGTVHGQKDQRTLAAMALDVHTSSVRAALDAYYVNEAQHDGLPLMTTFANAATAAPINAKTNTARGIGARTMAKTIAGTWEVDLAPQWQLFAAAGWRQQHSTGALNNALGMHAQADGTYTGVDMAIRDDTRAHSGELSLRGRFQTGSAAHALSLSATRMARHEGLQSRRSRWASNLYAPSTPVLTAAPNQTPKHTRTLWHSLALADTLAWQDGRYQLTVGLRLQRIDIHNDSANAPALQRERQQALAPTAALAVQPWQDLPVSVYANYSEGLSQGEAVTDSTAANYTERFKPYKSRQVELGLKWEHAQWAHTVSLFQITRPTLIYHSPSNRYSPEGQQRNRGLEWTFAGEFEGGLQLVGGLAHLQAVMTHTSDGLLNGKTAPGIAHWQANAGADWGLPWWPAWRLNAAALYTASMWADSANTQRLPPWWRLDLGASYHTRMGGHDWVMRLNLVNALNKRYWAGVWNGYASTGAARTVRLAVEVDF